LTGAGVSSQDRLFDTLDPVSRRIRISDRKEIILLDTVGFIRDLPTQLVAAFKATLEETVRSTMLIHVMDCKSREMVEQYRAVRSVLTELKIPDKEVITVLNKSDLIEPGPALSRLSKEWSAIAVSALTGAGTEDLLNEIMYRLGKATQVVHLLIPFSEAGQIDLLHRKARVLEEEFTAEGIKLSVEMEEALVRHYQDFRQEGVKC
jgi:GTP-binding protein HflX